MNEYIDNRHVDKKTINVNLNDSQIKFVTSKVTQTLTFKYLEKSLSEIITNKDQVSKIIDYIKKNREIKVINEIKRYSNN